MTDSNVKTNLAGKYEYIITNNNIGRSFSSFAVGQNYLLGFSRFQFGRDSKTNFLFPLAEVQKSSFFFQLKCSIL